MNIFYILLAAYVFGLIAISWYSSFNETDEGYLIAGRDRPWWQVMFSKYAASVGAGWFIAYSGFAYEFGLPLGTIFIGGIAGIFLYARWATPRILSQTKNTAYTQSDYVYACTNSVVAKDFLNIGVAMLTILSLLIAIVGSGLVLETFGLMSYETAVLFTMAVTVLYIFLSGFKAVMLTDVLQGILLILLLSIIVLGLLQVELPSAATLTETRNVSILGAVILTVFGFVSVFADPTRYQVTFAGRSTAEVRKGMQWLVLPVLITGIGIYLLGSTVYQLNPVLDSSEVFPAALTTYLPASLVPFGFLVFFVALMSTTDSYIYALATHTAHFFTKRPLSKNTIRIAVVVFSLIMIAISLYFRDVVDLAVLTGAVLLVIAFPMLYLIGGGRSGMRFVLLMAGGFVGMFAGILVLGLVPDAGAFVLLGLILSLLVPAKRLERLLA